MTSRPSFRSSPREDRSRPGSCLAPVSFRTFPLLGDLTVNKVIRARLKDSRDSAADIKTLMSRRDAALDLPPQDETLTESAIKTLRVEHAPTTGLLVLYPIDRTSPTARDRREPLNAADDTIGVGIVFPEPPPGEDAEVYYAADLARLRTDDGYLEEEDLSILEQE